MQIHRVGAEQFRRELADLLNKTGYGGDRVIIERHGSPLAVLIPYTLYEILLQQAPDVGPPPGFATPALAAQIETARERAAISYEEMAVALQAQRLRTLRETYPDLLSSAITQSLTDDAATEPT